MTAVRRFSAFKIAVVVVVTMVALRYVMVSDALSSASFGFGGTYSVGTGGPGLISCSLNTTTVTLTKPQTGQGTTSGTARLTCVNNLFTGTNLNVSVSTPNLTPAATGSFTASWPGSPGGASMSIPAKSSAYIDFTFSRQGKQDPPTTYTLTFDVNGSTSPSPSVMDYSRSGFSITVNLTN